MSDAEQYIRGVLIEMLREHDPCGPTECRDTRNMVDLAAIEMRSLRTENAMLWGRLRRIESELEDRIRRVRKFTDSPSIAVAVRWLESLISAARREARMREALERIVREGPWFYGSDAAEIAREALAETEGKP